MAEWYYRTDKGIKQGPVSNSELKNLVSNGTIASHTLLRKDDAKWVKASAVGGLFESVKEYETRNVCPYCNSAVFKVPGKCPSCNRDITVSLKTSERLESRQTESRPESRSVAAIRNILREESLEERRFIVIFAIMCTLHVPLGVWLYRSLEAQQTITSWLVGALLGVFNLATIITFLKARKLGNEESES